MPHNQKLISLRIKKIQNFIQRCFTNYLKQNLSSFVLVVLSCFSTKEPERSSLCTSIIHVNFLGARAAQCQKNIILLTETQNEKLISRLPLASKFHHSLSIVVVSSYNIFMKERIMLFGEQWKRETSISMQFMTATFLHNHQLPSQALVSKTDLLISSTICSFNFHNQEKFLMNDACHCSEQSFKLNRILNEDSHTN